MLSSWHPWLPSFCRKPSCRGHPGSRPRHHSILGGVIVGGRVGGGRAVLCIEGMFGNIPGLPPLDADYTPPPVATKRKYGQALLDVSLTPGLTYYNNREEKEHTQRCEETQTLCRNLTVPKSQWNNFQSSLTFILIQGACVARAHVGRTFPIGIYFKSDVQSQLWDPMLGLRE